MLRGWGSDKEKKIIQISESLVSNIAVFGEKDIDKGYDWLAEISRWGAYFAELAEPERENTQASSKHGCCRRRTGQRKPRTSWGNA